LRIDHGTVLLNGRRLLETYVPQEYRDTRSMVEMVVPEGAYFMMGDHRSISSDSREFWTVERSLIYGKARLHLLAGTGRGRGAVTEPFSGKSFDRNEAHASESVRLPHRRCRLPHRRWLKSIESTLRRRDAGDPGARRRAHLPWPTAMAHL